MLSSESIFLSRIAPRSPEPRRLLRAGKHHFLIHRGSIAKFMGTTSFTRAEPVSES